MAILIGFICIALGVSLAAGQWESFLVVLRGVLALSLMFWGLVSVLVGYSEMKARREYTAAVNDDSAPAAPRHAPELPTSAPDNPSASPHSIQAASVPRETPPVSET